MISIRVSCGLNIKTGSDFWAVSISGQIEENTINRSLFIARNFDSYCSYSTTNGFIFRCEDDAHNFASQLEKPGSRQEERLSNP